MSFVLARYGPRDGAGGMLGVLGPTRMAYGDVVANVRYVSDVLTELMRKLYEDETRSEWVRGIARKLLRYASEALAVSGES